MYTGLVTMVLGSALSYGRILGFVILAIFIVGFCLKALQEESILTKRYGSAYKEYKTKTKAFIPYIV
jgi:protein-S-isoprenylcysteine O-methyltransferase Ste14